MLSRDDVQNVLDDITYRDWILYLGDDNGRMYLQVQFWAYDVDAHERVRFQLSAHNFRKLQKGRKWVLSPYMTPTEIVRTAHKAIRTAVEHEVDENFMYKNHRIYGPHIDVEALIEASQKLEVRK